MKSALRLPGNEKFSKWLKFGAKIEKFVFIFVIIYNLQSADDNEIETKIKPLEKQLIDITGKVVIRHVRFVYRKAQKEEKKNIPLVRIVINCIGCVYSVVTDMCQHLVYLCDINDARDFRFFSYFKRNMYSLLLYFIIFFIRSKKINVWMNPKFGCNRNIPSNITTITEKAITWIYRQNHKKF